MPGIPPLRESLPGYDAWKLAAPEEGDDEEPCRCCGEVPGLGPCACDRWEDE